MFVQWVPTVLPFVLFEQRGPEPLASKDPHGRSKGVCFLLISTYRLHVNAESEGNGTRLWSGSVLAAISSQKSKGQTRFRKPQLHACKQSEKQGAERTC